ncbi:MAG: hypothetical protein GEU82_05265 [Luteitalea sp.]|nr:hypothetical protein [Luteitalea sp.]
MTGRIVDAQGGAIANADITVSTAGKPMRSVRTGQDGSFRVDALPPGEYTLLVEALGFAPSAETATLGDAAVSLSIEMQVAAISEDVTVRALAGTIATGRTTLPLRELPLTVNTVLRQIIEEQAANDLPSVLQNVGGVHAFTAYGVYE